MVDHGLQRPEFHSVRLHLAPGAGSFFALADALAGAAAQMTGIGGGYQANAGALGAGWMGPASEVAIAVDLPHQAWVGDVAAQIATAGTQIAAAGAAFEAAKLAISTPAEIAGVQSEYAMLVATNFFGINIVPMILNRLRYFEMWIRAAIAMFTYEAVSAATVGSLSALPPPPPGVAAGAADPLAAVEQALQKPIQQVVQGAEAVWGSVQGPLNAIAPFALPVGMGLLSAAPMMAMSVPMMGMSAGMQLGSQLAGSGGLAGASAPAGETANTASWMGATSDPGGPVAASISSGGGGAGAGSTASAIAPLRSPGSWASSSAVAAPAAGSDTDQVPSRIAEAREASTKPATWAGMGTPGAMMAPPASRDSQSEQPQQRDSSLAAAAALYRGPTQIPVVTGANGARFVAEVEDG